MQNAYSYRIAYIVINIKKLLKTTFDDLYENLLTNHYVSDSFILKYNKIRNV